MQNNSYQVRLIYHRFGHHSTHSGYDRLACFMEASGIGSGDKPFLARLIPPRLVRSALGRAKIGAYDEERLGNEIRVIGELYKPGKKVFHFLYGDDAYCYSGFVPRSRNKKIVASFHQPPEYFEKAIRRKNHIDKLDGIVTLDQRQYDYFSELISKEKVCLVKHGVDTDFFRAVAVSQRYEARCLFVGNWFRDFETLKKVVANVKARKPEVEFVIVTTEKRRPIVEQIPDAAIRIAVEEDELLGLYQSCTMLVLPLEDCTANNSVLEALACGVPIVTTDVGGIRDYADEKCALFARPGDAETMSDHVIGLLGDREKQELMGLHARELALQLSWKHSVEQLHAFYARLFE